MEDDFVSLYSEKDITLLKKRLGIWTAVCVIIGAAALAVCVSFAVSAYFTETRELFIPTVLVSVFGGFSVITVYRFVIEDIRAAIKHTEAMLKGEAEIVAGSFTVTGEKLFIRKGVPIVRVKVAGNELVSSLQIYDKKAALLDGSAERVATVYGFVTAYGKHEDI